MSARRMAIIVFAFALGCSGGDKPRVPVYGHVAYRGSPVRGGAIAFTPDKERGTHGEPGRATLGPDGAFRMPEGGLPPGWYRITLASLETCIPSRYRDPDSANLVREIVAGRENSFEFYLDD